MTRNATNAVSRRTALTGLGAVGLGLALTTSLPGSRHPAAVQAATPASQSATPSAAGQTARINGAEIYYEIHGPADGTPVFLLHGSLSSLEDFNLLVPALVAAGYRAVAMDSRGRGRSSWGDDPISYDQMTADSVGLLDHLGIDSADIVGWSQGGVIGLEIAIHHPERLDRLVAYGANYAPEGLYAEIHPSDQLPPFETVVANYQRLSPEPQRFDELFGVIGAINASSPKFTPEELGGITAPVLVLDGAEEEFIDPEHTKRLASMIPGAKLVIMPDTGHFAMSAKTAEFNQIVLNFLSGAPLATPAA